MQTLREAGLHCTQAGQLLSTSQGLWSALGSSDAGELMVGVNWGDADGKRPRGLTWTLVFGDKQQLAVKWLHKHLSNVWKEKRAGSFLTT